MKILARIIANRSANNFIFDENKPLVYELVGNGQYLFGTNGVICQCFYLEQSSWQAFSGREFTLTMKDGSKMKCHGQWFHGGATEISKILGINIISISCKTQKDMEECFVLGSCFAIKEELDKLIDQYKKENEGFEPLYKYWDYERVLKHDKLRSKYYRQERYFKRAKQNILNNLNLKKAKQND